MFPASTLERPVCGAAKNRIGIAYIVQKTRTGEVKIRMVAGGNRQRGYIDKEDVSLPTVTTESVLLSCIINAKEGRDVAIIEIPNTFMQTVIKNEKDKFIMRMHGEVVDILCKLSPETYKPFVTMDKRGNRQILMKCLNALNGLMVASLLYCRKFTNSLKSRGFKMNPYDPCVWNKMVHGKQLTICFHIDDCKLLHMSPKVLDETIEWLRED